MCEKSNIMKRTKYVLLPRLSKILERLGEDVKLAWLRRKLNAVRTEGLTVFGVTWDWQ